MTPEVQAIAADIRTTISRIDAGVQELARQARAEAEAERTYRRAVARAWVHIDRTDMLASEAQASVKATTADERYARDLARGMWTSAREALRARQQELSSHQSLLKIEQAEAELVAYGPDRGAAA